MAIMEKSKKSGSFKQKPIVTKTTTTTPAPRSNGHTVTHEERYRMIAESAYYRAEQRGYEPGHEVEDWLAAEAEVDAKIKAMGATLKA